MSASAWPARYSPAAHAGPQDLQMAIDERLRSFAWHILGQSMQALDMFKTIDERLDIPFGKM